MESTEVIERPGADFSAIAARAFALDFSLPRPFAILGFFYLVLRAPFLNHGHGTDPDAWRVALTAHYLLDNAKYFPSRLPGNPLHELVMTPLVPGGWIATNFATALVSLLGVYLFARIAAHHRLPNAGLLTIGFAFAPLLYINSIATMDYMWTLTALLGAYYCAIRRWPLFAGLCLGLAIGFRLQSFIVWLPLAYLVWRYATVRDVIVFTLAAAAVATLAFAPVLAVYGLDFFNFYDAPVAYKDVIRLLGKEALGVIGGLGVLAGLALSLPRLSRLPRDLLREPAVAVWTAMVLIYFVSFFRLPHEIAYVIPVFPFGLLIMGRYCGRVALATAVGSILLAGLIDVTTPSDDLSVDSFREATLGQGLILSNADTMEAQRDFVDEVLSAEVPDHSVVMAGFVYPQLAVRAKDRLDVRILQRDYGAISMLSDRGEAVDTTRDVHYVWLLTYEAFMALRSEGYAFYLVPDAVGGTSALYDYRPTLFGAAFLNLERESPSAGKGTASTDR